MRAGNNIEPEKRFVQQSPAEIDDGSSFLQICWTSHFAHCSSSWPVRQHATLGNVLMLNEKHTRFVSWLVSNTFFMAHNLAID